MPQVMPSMFTLAMVLTWVHFSGAVAAGEENSIIGTWKLISMTVQNGEKSDVPADTKVTIEKDKMTRTAEGKNETVPIKLDPTKSPKQIDITIVGPDGSSHLVPGIYKLEGDRLTIKTGKPKDPDAQQTRTEKVSERPTGFDEKTGAVIVLNRVKE